jgi:hypothetical protein
VLAKALGLCIAAIAAILAYFAFMARIDTPEELSSIRTLDLELGALFALAFLLHRIPAVLHASALRNAATAGAMIAVWVTVSGTLLLWHEYQVRVRWHVSARSLATNQSQRVHVALLAYARDCGGFPSPDQGLAVLWKNPRTGKWSGPYVEPDDVIDPWGNPLRYSVRDNQVRVWSAGPDGKSGTEDDIESEANARGGPG